MRGRDGRRKSRPWWPLAAGSFALFFSPARAEAHTPIKGAGEFVSGFLHPFLTPVHVLVLLSLGLLLGQSVPLRLRRPLVVFGAFAVLGLAATAAFPVPGVNQTVLITLGLCAGGLVALAAPLPSWIRLLACGGAGLTLGLDSGVDPGTGGATMARTLLATWIALLFCLGDIAYYSARLPRYKWVLTGIRVVGSWIVAIAVLMLAFALRR